MPKEVKVIVTRQTHSLSINKFLYHHDWKCDKEIEIATLKTSLRMEHGEQVGELPGFHKVERTVVIVKADDND